MPSSDQTAQMHKLCRDIRCSYCVHSSPFCVDKSTYYIKIWPGRKLSNEYSNFGGVCPSRRQFTFIYISYVLREMRHARKRTFGHMHPAKIQIRESSLAAFWIAKHPKFHADNEDSDQTARMRRLI